MNVYEPAEDTFLLAGAVDNFAYGKVLDMGTGSGYLAIRASQSKKVNSVVACDVSEGAVIAARKNTKQAPVRIIKSDLFESIKGKFDTMLFNPPYLPQDSNMKDAAIYGGKHGYEVIERFIPQTLPHLNSHGQILLLFSSLTRKAKVEEILDTYALSWQKVAEQAHFFEKLYVYRITRSSLLESLNNKGIHEIEKYSKGHRGIIHRGRYRNKDVAIKSKLPQSAAVGRIRIEGDWLKRLNKKAIGPKLLFKEKDYICYEFVDGIYISDYLLMASERRIRDVIISVLRQCRNLDELRVDKEEMHRPYKHILIKKSIPVMLDFERCHHVVSPKNVTQFCQFIRGSHLAELLYKKNMRVDRAQLLTAAKAYKNNQSKKNFEKILHVISH